MPSQLAYCNFFFCVWKSCFVAWEEKNTNAKRIHSVCMSMANIILVYSGNLIGGFALAHVPHTCELNFRWATSIQSTQTYKSINCETKRNIDCMFSTDFDPELSSNYKLQLLVTYAYHCLGHSLACEHLPARQYNRICVQDGRQLIQMHVYLVFAFMFVGLWINAYSVCGMRCQWKIEVGWIHLSKATTYNQSVSGIDSMLCTKNKPNW